MRARHRLSKLLLRHGIVYYGGAAWTGAHDQWLRREAAPRLTAPATAMAFDADYEHVLTMVARRRRLDKAIEEMAADCEFTPIVRRVSCLRGVSTLTGFALAVEIGDWIGSPATVLAHLWDWCPRSIHQDSRGYRDRSPKPVTPTYADFWSRRRGITVLATRWAR